MAHVTTHETQEVLLDMLTPREAIPVLRLSRSTFHRHLRNGTIPSVKLGRRRLIRRSDLIKLLTPKEAEK